MGRSSTPPRSRCGTRKHDQPPLEARPPDGTRVDSSPTLKGNGVVIPATLSSETSAISEVQHHQPILVVDDEATVRVPARDAPGGEATACRPPGIRLMHRGRFGRLLDL